MLMWAKSVFRWIDAHLFFPLETVEGKIGPSLLLYPAINQGAAINWVRTSLLVDDANKISAGCLPRVLTAPWRLANSPALSIALPNAYFAELGLPSMVVRS